MLFRRKLDSPETAGHTFGQGKSQRGFAHAGDILQKDVAPGQNGGQDLDKDRILAHNGFFYFRDDLRGQISFVHSRSFLPCRPRAEGRQGIFSYDYTVISPPRQQKNRKSPVG